MGNEKKFELKKLIHKPTKEEIWRLVGALVSIYAAMRMVLNLCYVSESLYQTIRDGFLWKSMIYFMIIVLVANKTRILNWQTGVLAAVCIPLIFLLPAKYKESSPDLYNIYFPRYIVIALCLVLLLDIILYKKIVILKGRNLWFSILYVVCFLPAMILNKGGHYTILPFFPVLALLFIRLTKEDWIRVCFRVSIGYYLAFAYTMAKSFMTVPYTGERYYGIFINNGLFGIFAGGAFICALYWLVMEIRREKKRIPLIVIDSLAMAFALVCVDLISARVAMLAVFVVAVAAFILLAKKKKNLYTRLAITVGVLAGVAVLAIIVILLLKDVSKDDIRTSISNTFVCEKVLYLHRIVQYLFREDSKHGVIQGGTLLNTIDWFSSGRISYWIAYMEDMNLWGHESMSLEASFRFLMHPHNTYISWLYQFGIIPGALYIILFFAAVAVSVREVIKGKSEHIFAFLWLAYCLVVYINEVEQWGYQIGFLNLFVLYIMAMNMNEKVKS